MTNYKRGDVILVEVIFSEGTGSKKRPALVISSNEYNNNRQEIIILAITSNINRVLMGDTIINGWEDAGLKYPSLAAGIIQTIKSNIIISKLGVISKKDMQKIEKTIGKIIPNS